MTVNQRTDRRLQDATRIIASEDAIEVYLTVPADGRGTVLQQMDRAYWRVRQVLHETGAAIVCERVFGTAGTLPAVTAVRRNVLGEHDDGIPSTRLVTDSSSNGSFAGVQVYAVRTPIPPTPVFCGGEIGGAAAGRLIEHDGRRWLFVNGLCASEAESPAEQARRMFFCAGCFLQQVGGSMQSVARTWLWLRDVCGWYNQFNAARNAFFHEQGLIDPVARQQRLPASTGIGLYEARGAACTLDLIALPGQEDQITLIEAGGDQESAYEYGSAFSRAAVAPTPAGRTLFISGTAAIDASGDTEHVDQVEAQIEDTINHVRSLMRQTGCGDGHTLTALVYCKNQQVEQVFRRMYDDLEWPQLVLIGDVCRPELLFEVELTASLDALPLHDPAQLRSAGLPSTNRWRTQAPHGL